MAGSTEQSSTFNVLATMPEATDAQLQEARLRAQEWSGAAILAEYGITWGVGEPRKVGVEMQWTPPPNQFSYQLVLDMGDFIRGYNARGEVPPPPNPADYRLPAST